MKENFLFDWFGGILMFCPTQDCKCEHHGFFGDGAFLVCQNEECIKSGKCLYKK